MAEPLPLLIPHPALTHGRTQYALAKDEVNYVGEAIAFVVADDRYVAEDAIGRIRVAYEFLPPVVGIDAARAATSLVHDDVPGNVGARMEQENGDARAAIASAPHTLTLDLTIERSACMPMEGRGTVARWDPDVRPDDRVDLDPDLDRRPRGGRRQARPRPRPGRRDHPRRRRRLRREDQPPVARGAAGADGGAGPRPAGEVHRGPARALHLLGPRARPGPPHRGRVRRRRPAARAGRRVLARPRRVHAVRPDRPDHHLDPAARPLQAAELPGGLRVDVHQHRHGHAVPRRRAAAGLLRDGADHGRDRGVPRQGPHRRPVGELHPARRVPLRPGADLPGRPRAGVRLRRLPGVAGEAEGAGRLGRVPGVPGGDGAPRGAGSGSAWPATSRAPASAPTRARTCTSRPRARSRSRPA